MDAIRVVHFADLHLGVESGGRANPATGLNQRIHDVLDRLDEVCECVEREGVHLVVFAGDAFKHQHPTPTLQSLFAERIRRLARTAGVLLLVGNHDLPRMASLRHPFSIYDALEVERVVVGERAAVYRVPLPGQAPAEAVQVAALPHFSRHQVLAALGGQTPPEQVDDRIAAALHDRVHRLQSEIDPALPAVFAGHCHVSSAEVTAGQRMFGASDVEVPLSSLVQGDAFPYYALGHLHKHQVLSESPFAAYSGSLERVDFGEGEVVRVDASRALRRARAEDKGFYRFDLAPGEPWRIAGPPEFRTVNARGFVTIRVEAPPPADPNDCVLAAIGSAREAGCNIAGAFVRLVATVDATDRPRLNHPRLKDALRDAYDVSIVAQSSEDSLHVRDPRFGKRMSELDALERYVQSKSEWAGDKDAILAAGRALVDEVLR